jgi:hypothetical protein
MRVAKAQIVFEMPTFLLLLGPASGLGCREVTIDALFAGGGRELRVLLRSSVE